MKGRAIAGAVVAGIVIGIGAGAIAFDDGSPLEGVLGFEAGEPPPEYLYLDTARVLAYLGQIDGGLTTAERRSFQQTDEIGGGVSGAGVSVSAKQQRVGSVEQDVTAGTTDRFYRLLGALKGGHSGTHRWLFTIDAHLHGRHTAHSVLDTLGHVRVGDFLRITRARAYVAPYAAVYPKTSYSLSYLAGDLERPRRPLFAQVSKACRMAASRYRKEVGDNPRIPIVVPTLNDQHTTRAPVRFVVPVRRDGLTSEPSSLAGEMTIVGKVIYLDARVAADVPRGDANPPYWTDLETVHTFAPALAHAQPPLLRLLDLARFAHARHRLTRVVRNSATFSAPVVVVLPIAMYQ